MDWIRPGQQTFKPRRESQVDKNVSEIVGKEVKVNDPRLVNLVNKWRSRKDPNQFDNFLKDPNKIRELRNEFK